MMFCMGVAFLETFRFNFCREGSGPGSQDWETKEKQTEGSCNSWLRRPECGESSLARSPDIMYYYYQTGSEGFGSDGRNAWLRTAVEVVSLPCCGNGRICLALDD
jgi:hypothetical protein